MQVNYVTAYERLFVGDLTPEIASETQSSIVKSSLNKSTNQHCKGTFVSTRAGPPPVLLNIYV